MARLFSFLNEKLLKNPCVKNILSALAVATLGYILVIFTVFIGQNQWHDLLARIVNIFIPIDFRSTPVPPDVPNPHPWFNWMVQISWVVLIGLIFWVLFRSKIGNLLKAAFIPVPLVIYESILASHIENRVFLLIVRMLILIGILFYLYRTKQPWLYHYSVILSGLLVLAIYFFTG